MLRKQRYLIPAVVTAFWLVMMALFLHREGWLGPAPNAAPSDFRPQDEWMGIYLDGDRRVGYLHLKSDTAERHGAPGYNLALDARIETTLFGIAARMDIEGTAWSAADGSHSEFDFSLVSGDHAMGIEGAVADNVLEAILHTGGEEVPLQFPVESAIFPTGGLGMPAAGMPVLEPGEITYIEALDPMTMRVKPAKIECLGRETLEIHGTTYPTVVYETTIGTITSKAWIDPERRIIQATTPFGFTLRLIDPESLDIPLDAGDRGDLIGALAIRATGETPIVDAARMTVRITGVDAARVPHDPPWQRREGDLIYLERPDPLPDAGTPPPAPAFDTAPYLKGDPFIAVDNPLIVEHARQIVGDESNAWRQSMLLYDWLYRHIEKVPVLSVPNALDTLRTRQGDCNEHAVLFTALARALGIPCRIAIGLVYSDTLGAFGYHAWPEVYYGAWYPLDPTLGQPAADATHIKLLNGNIEAWMQLVAYIGQIELEVISIE